MAKVTLPLERAHELKGMTLGPTEWKDVTQQVIDQFAEATGDRQWIHVDRERAAKESPFRKTIAHGYFTLALVPVFFWEMVEVTGVRLVINYGSNKVRWPAPVPIPSRIRMVGEISELMKLESGFDVVLQAKVEVENQRRPAMVAEVLYRYYT
ncbi:MAG TPA: MaoC family dehydratase [Myxococcales bacterium]|jgi:acyl dehydratase